VDKPSQELCLSTRQKPERYGRMAWLGSPATGDRPSGRTRPWRSRPAWAVLPTADRCI